MIKFCHALSRSGISLTGLKNNRCGKHRTNHDHVDHFVNPYDFEDWKGRKDNCYAWEAKPYQREPMPGLAAFNFIQNKQGIIMFKHYWDTAKTDMWGGHIDFWAGDRMGNTRYFDNPMDGESAFLRARKIVFWPLPATGF
jgi:hypothetical protein